GGRGRDGGGGLGAHQPLLDGERRARRGGQLLVEALVAGVAEPDGDRPARHDRTGDGRPADVQAVHGDVGARGVGVERAHAVVGGGRRRLGRRGDRQRRDDRGGLGLGRLGLGRFRLGRLGLGRRRRRRGRRGGDARDRGRRRGRRGRRGRLRRSDRGRGRGRRGARRRLRRS